MQLLQRSCSAVSFLASPSAEGSALKVTSVLKVDNASREQ